MATKNLNISTLIYFNETQTILPKEGDHWVQKLKESYSLINNYELNNLSYFSIAPSTSVQFVFEIAWILINNRKVPPKWSNIRKSFEDSKNGKSEFQKKIKRYRPDHSTLEIIRELQDIFLSSVNWNMSDFFKHSKNLGGVAQWVVAQVELCKMTRFSFIFNSFQTQEQNEKQQQQIFTVYSDDSDDDPIYKQQQQQYQQQYKYHFGEEFMTLQKDLTDIVETINTIKKQGKTAFFFTSSLNSESYFKYKGGLVDVAKFWEEENVFGLGKDSNTEFARKQIVNPLRSGDPVLIYFNKNRNLDAYFRGSSWPWWDPEQLFIRHNLFKEKFYKKKLLKPDEDRDISGKFKGVFIANKEFSLNLMYYSEKKVFDHEQQIKEFGLDPKHFVAVQL